MTNSRKLKGDLLEKIVNTLCSRFVDAKVEANVRVTGKSGVARQVDTLISGRIGAFPVTVVIDAKNHASPIDIGEVEGVAGLTSDVGGNLGIIVCPSGFTSGAKLRAENLGIQLYEIFHEHLGNTDQLVPLQYIEARIDKFAWGLTATSAAGQFRLPFDQSGLRFHLETKALEARELSIHAWNKGVIPQKAGEYNVDLGPVKLTDMHDSSYVQYCDLSLKVSLVEDYYLKLYPASFLRRIDDSKDGRQAHHDLRLDIYSSKEQMLRRPQDVRAAAERFESLGAKSCYAELRSDHGHDAFLAEPEALASILGS